MPTYVYECSACNKVFEADQRITEDPLKDCACGGKSTLKRLIQPVAVAFKGSGFHINDYAPKTATSESAAAEPAKAAEAATPTSAEKTEATAPATESASAPATPAPVVKSE